MDTVHGWGGVAILVIAGVLGFGWSPRPVLAEQLVPFHSEVIFQMEMVPVPEGHCGAPLPQEPAGLEYLWLTRATGTAISTHLGRGPVYGELCVFGMVVEGQPMPMGYYFEMVWTAANGDELMATGALSGFTGTPDDPSMLIESLTFMDGEAGRFTYTWGTATGLVDPKAGTAVYDGWIRYGKRPK